MKLDVGSALLGSVVALSCVLGEASARSTTKPPTASIAEAKRPEAESLALQRERLELDKQKFASDRAAEKEKLELERVKVEVEQSKVWWSALAAIVPLLAGLFTIGYGVWSFRRQTQLQVAGQKDAAQLAFDIKAAEIAFEGKTPEAVRNRGKALKDIFGDRLSPTFMQGFDPRTVGGSKETPEVKQFFLELLLKYPDEKSDIVEYWDQLFPGDHTWLKRVRLTESRPRPPTVDESDK
jgi:hypothetical protein